MKTLNEEIARIKSEVADIPSKAFTGKSIQQRVDEVFAEITLPTKERRNTMSSFSVIRINYATNSVEQDNIDSFEGALELYDRHCGEGCWSVVIIHNNITDEDVAIMEYEDPYDFLDADEFDALVDCDDEDTNEKMEADARKKWNVHAETDAAIHEFWFAEWDAAKRCYENFRANNRVVFGCITSGETGEPFADFARVEDSRGKGYRTWTSKEYDR